MTFHWATNYGAVLQAYALQNYLMEQGFDTKIINYVPKMHKKTLLRAFKARNPRKVIFQVKEYKKEQKIERFRKKNLSLTQIFEKNEELREADWKNGIFICGSDQIWNPYFTMNGEGEITTSYFFDFLPKGSIKLAYGASFGVQKLDRQVSEVIKPYLLDFHLITVREKTAINILNDIGCKSFLVCDPVFLLKKEIYIDLFDKKIVHSNGTIFKYILHQNQKVAYQVANFVAKSKNLISVE